MPGVGPHATRATWPAAFHAEHAGVVPPDVPPGAMRPRRHRHAVAFGRRRRVRLNLLSLLVQLWCGICLVGFLAPVVALLYLPGDLRTFHLARDLRHGGAAASSTDVSLRVVNGGKFVDVRSVRVRFVTREGVRVEAGLTGVDDPWVPEETGWQPPGARSRYRTPLQLLYLPEDPHRVMAATDATQEWLVNPWVEAGQVAAVGLAPSVLSLVAVVAWVTVRPAAGRRRAEAARKIGGRARARALRPVAGDRVVRDAQDRRHQDRQHQDPPQR